MIKTCFYKRITQGRNVKYAAADDNLIIVDWRVGFNIELGKKIKKNKKIAISRVNKMAFIVFLFLTRWNF